MDPQFKRRAGHYEILGETVAKFEFFEQGWNPYSRFLDVDKVDLVLRRTQRKKPLYREIQVKYGKLYPVSPAWERPLFDITSWRFFRPGEFDQSAEHLFLAYVLARDEGYSGDFFLFPIGDFARLIHRTPLSGGKHRVCISRSREGSDRWYLRLASRFSAITDENCVDVSVYRRAFHLLEQS